MWLWFLSKSASVLLGRHGNSFWRSSGRRRERTPDLLGFLRSVLSWWRQHQGPVEAVPTLPGLLGLYTEDSCVFGVEFGTNRTAPWWYCTMDKYLLVFVSTEDTLVLTKSPTPCPFQMQPQTRKEPPPSFSVTCRHSLFCSPALLRSNLLQPNIHQSGASAAIGAPQFPSFQA